MGPNGMSAQAYEDVALLEFNKGFMAKAAILIKDGARISLGRGRSSRMREYAFYIETYGDYLNGKSFDSFIQMQEYIENNEAIPNRAF